MATILEVAYAVVDEESIDSKPIPYDSFVDFKINARSKVPEFSIEDGSFAQYNKALTPSQITIRLAKTGTVEAREAFVWTLRQQVGKPTKFAIITPEQVFVPYTLAGFNYIHSNSGGGRGQVIASCEFTEIREVAPKYSSKVKLPAARNTQDTGKDEPGPYVPDVIVPNLRGG